MPSSTISSKGQITLPVEVRKRLGVKSGDAVEFYFENDSTVVRPARSEVNPFEAFMGIAPIEDSVAWARDLRDDEYEAGETRKRMEARKRRKTPAAA